MIERLAIRLGRVLLALRCGWRGHDDRRRVDAHRRAVTLECADCGRQTAGWDLGTLPAPARRQPPTGRQLRTPRIAAVYRGRLVVDAPLRRRREGQPWAV